VSTIPALLRDVPKVCAEPMQCMGFHLLALMLKAVRLLQRDYTVFSQKAVIFMGLFLAICDRNVSLSNAVMIIKSRTIG
jgi:hypothetical protein